jgi:hypothetical protein
MFNVAAVQFHQIPEHWSCLTPIRSTTMYSLPPYEDALPVSCFIWVRRLFLPPSSSLSDASCLTTFFVSSCYITPWIDLLNDMKIDIQVAINFVYIHIIHNVDAIQIRSITHCMSSCTSVSPISFLSRAASFSCYITSWIDLINDTHHSMQSSFSYTA